MDAYTVLSMRRSGCHAVAQWIGSLYDEPAQYCNMGDRVTDIIADGAMATLHERRVFPKTSPLIYGKENQAPTLNSVGVLSSTIILNLRDPFNMLASTFSLNGIKPTAAQQAKVYGEPEKAEDKRQPTRNRSVDEFSKIIKQWIDYALTFTGKWSELPDDTVLLNYNDWATSKAYRKALAKRLGRPFSDAGFMAVPAHGGGSSFDKRKELEEEEAKRRMERYKLYADNEVYLKTLSRPFIWDLAEELFPQVTEEARKVLLT